MNDAVHFVKMVNLAEEANTNTYGAFLNILKEYDAARTLRGEVDMEEAFRCALALCDEAEVWTRPLGLAGKWGGIVRRWLEELLPMDVRVMRVCLHAILALLLVLLNSDALVISIFLPPSSPATANQM